MTAASACSSSGTTRPAAAWKSSFFSGVIENARDRCYLEDIAGAPRRRGALIRRTLIWLIPTVRSRTPPARASAGTPRGASETLTSDLILERILSSLDDDKAEDVVQVNLSGKSDMADYMIIASGRSSRQVAAIAEKMVDRLKQDLGVLAKVEGKEAADWVLVDAGDVIVHVFRPEVRDFYQLEKDVAEPGGDRRPGLTCA